MNRFSKHLPRISGLTSNRVIVLALIAVIGILYSPSFTALFNADDFSFLRYLYFNIQPLLSGRLWYEWLVGGIVNYAVFRPLGHVFWLLNYVTFGLEPYGYHVAAVLFHLITSFAVSILSYLLTRKRMTAAIAALLFAMMPVHAEAVSWLAANYDVWCAIYSFVSLIFYILYRQRLAPRFYFVALGAFVLALSSREIALALPIMLLVYDLVYHPGDWNRAPRVYVGYVPFWIAVAIRLIFFGHGYRGLILAPEGWFYYVDFNLLRVFDPWSGTIDEIRWVALACVAVLLLAYRLRPAVLFGLIWIPVMLAATTVGGVNDRSFYVASFGVSLLLAIVLTSLLTRKDMIANAVGLIGLILLIAIYSAMLFSRNQAYARASQVAQEIVQRVKELHPTIPPDARLVFVGVPDSVPEGAPVFGAGLPEALSIAYQRPAVAVSKFSKFPIWLDHLDHTYFFLADHRRVTERTDLIATLETRVRCASFSQPAITWDMTRDSEGWAPWNQLDGFENRSGALVTRSVGNDPFMGSPTIDIPAIAIGDIEITMRVNTTQPTFQGKVYWLASGQQDFSPALKQSFTGQADGEFHTYRVDIAQSGMLLLGDHITRLRLDPVDAPAEIAIKSIQVDTHCASGETSQCVCGQ